MYVTQPPYIQDFFKTFVELLNVSTKENSSLELIEFILKWKYISAFKKNS